MSVRGHEGCRDPHTHCTLGASARVSRKAKQARGHTPLEWVGVSRDANQQRGTGR